MFWIKNLKTDHSDPPWKGDLQYPFASRGQEERNTVLCVIHLYE